MTAVTNTAPLTLPVVPRPAAMSPLPYPGLRPSGRARTSVTGAAGEAVAPVRRDRPSVAWVPGLFEEGAS